MNDCDKPVMKGLRNSEPSSIRDRTAQLEQERAIKATEKIVNRHADIGLAGGIISGLAIWVTLIYLAFGPAYHGAVRDVHARWHTNTAVVTALSDVRYTNAVSTFVVGDVKYPDWNGQPQTVKAVLSAYSTHVGDPLPVRVSKTEGYYLPDDLGQYGADPYADLGGDWKFRSILLGWFPGALGGIVLGLSTFALLQRQLWLRSKLKLLLRGARTLKPFQWLLGAWVASKVRRDKRRRK